MISPIPFIFIHLHLFERVGKEFEVPIRRTDNRKEVRRSEKASQEIPEKENRKGKTGKGKPEK
jgi:hypothetical protein